MSGGSKEQRGLWDVLHAALGKIDDRVTLGLFIVCLILIPTIAAVRSWEVFAIVAGVLVVSFVINVLFHWRGAKQSAAQLPEVLRYVIENAILIRVRGKDTRSELAHHIAGELRENFAPGLYPALDALIDHLDRKFEAPGPGVPSKPEGTAHQPKEKRAN